MKLRSFNQELIIAQTLLTQQLNDIIIDRRSRVNNDFKVVEVKKELVQVPCLFGSRDTILKSLENESGIIKLPLIILSRTSFQTDTVRNADLHIDLLSMPGNKRNPAVHRGIPISISYNITLVSRYYEDLDQIISNFSVQYRPDTYVKWYHPRIKNKPIESQILWGQSFNFDDVSSVDAKTQLSYKASGSFTFKTWLFPGLDTEPDESYPSPDIINNILDKWWAVPLTIPMETFKQQVAQGLVDPVVFSSPDPTHNLNYQIYLIPSYPDKRPSVNFKFSYLGPNDITDQTIDRTDVTKVFWTYDNNNNVIDKIPYIGQDKTLNSDLVFEYVKSSNKLSIKGNCSYRDLSYQLLIQYNKENIINKNVIELPQGSYTLQQTLDKDNFNQLKNNIYTTFGQLSSPMYNNITDANITKYNNINKLIQYITEVQLIDDVNIKVNINDPLYIDVDKLSLVKQTTTYKIFINNYFILILDKDNKIIDKFTLINPEFYLYKYPLFEIDPIYYGFSNSFLW